MLPAAIMINKSITDLKITKHKYGTYGYHTGIVHTNDGMRVPSVNMQNMGILSFNLSNSFLSGKKFMSTRNETLLNVKERSIKY